MKKFYFFSAIIVTILILILAFAQVGASCSWYLISSQSKAFMVLLWVAVLGAVDGGLIVLWWKQPKPGTEGGENDVEGEGE